MKTTFCFVLALLFCFGNGMTQTNTSIQEKADFYDMLLEHPLNIETGIRSLLNDGRASSWYGKRNQGELSNKI